MKTETQNNVIKKRKSHAFNKDIYLLGVDENNENVWLEAPSWDCGWYWGFGYVERYTNNQNPSKVIDITSHTHINSEFVNEGGTINLNKGLIKTTYTKNEGERLNILFTRFYTLKELARKEKEKAKQINENMIPKITDEIIKILSK